jgi:hypothetical protein
MRRTIGRLATVGVLALVAAGCGDGTTIDTAETDALESEIADLRAELDELRQADDEPEAPISTTTTTTTATTTEAPARGNGTIDNPFPVEGASIFTYSEGSGSPRDSWEGSVLGLIETGKRQSNDQAGRCLVLLGTITPTELSEGVISKFRSAPRISLIVGGALLDNVVNECDTDAIEASGYGWILDVAVSVGTPYPFRSEFFLPGDAAVQPEVIAVGDPTGDEAVFFEPTILPDIPSS